MHPFQKCTVIKPLLFLALMWAGAFAYAGPPIGAIMHLSGPLLATKADGSSRVLATNSTVEQGDTLITQKNGYAQIKFSDESLLILQPDTVLTIDRFSYDADKPDADDIALTLTQGGVRSTAGLIGKRSQDRVTLTTPAGTVNLQGASAIIQYRKQSAVAQAAALAYLMASTAGLDSWQMTSRSDAGTSTAMAIRPLTLAQAALPPSPTAAKAPGLYVQVLDGVINLSNPAGTTAFSAGQFGYTPSVQNPPVVLPANPGLTFTPPPAFNAPPTTSSATQSKGAAVDCVVR
jgi:hypothetical protein